MGSLGKRRWLLVLPLVMSMFLVSRFAGREWADIVMIGLLLVTALVAIWLGIEAWRGARSDDA